MFLYKLISVYENKLNLKPNPKEYNDFTGILKLSRISIWAYINKNKLLCGLLN